MWRTSDPQRSRMKLTPMTFNDSESAIALLLWIGGTSLWCLTLYAFSRFAMTRWGERKWIIRTAKAFSIFPLLSLIVSWALFARIRWSTGVWPFWDSSFGIIDGEFRAYNPTHQGDAFATHFILAQALHIVAIFSIVLLGPIALAAALKVARLKRPAWVFACSWLAFFAYWRLDPGEMMSWLASD